MLVGMFCEMKIPLPSAVIFTDIFIKQSLLGWQNIPIFMQIKLFAL